MFFDHHLIQYGKKKERPKKTIVDYFIETAKKHPEKKCLTFNGNEYSYKELNENVDCLCNAITASLFGKQNAIIVFDDDPFYQISAIIAIMKTGNIFIPISNSIPSNRIKTIVKECNAIAYMSLKKHNELDLEFISKTDIQNTEHFEYKNNSSYDEKAYIIYTSGTTGSSKGVIINHYALANAVLSRSELLEIKPNDDTIILMGFSFDGFLMSVFSPLICGCCMHFPSNIFDIDNICSIIKQGKIATFICTPTMIHNILNSQSRNLLDNVRLICLAGEQIDKNTIRQIKNENSEIIIANEYGPTENTICTSINCNITNDKFVTAGNIIYNVNAIILDDFGMPCEPNKSGELYLSGMGLSNGYVQQDQSNEENFIIVDGIRWYKTGDIAYFTDNKELVILNRKDSQAKINGYRVDFLEIQAVLNNYSKISKGVVFYSNDKRIIAIFSSNSQINKAEIREYMLSKLPRYMVPMAYYQTDDFDLKDSGKIDIASIEKKIKSNEIKELCDSRDSHNKDINEAINIICDCYKQVLSLADCYASSDFFSLGGTSIKAFKIAQLINDKMNLDLDVDDIFLYSTPIELAMRISRIYDKNIVDNSAIQPFNSYWFVDCYYTSILAILKNYNRPLAPFIRAFKITDFIYNNEYQLVFEKKRNLKDIFKESGMISIFDIFENDFESKVISLIESGYVVMLHIDCFYISYFSDKYKKQHFEHVFAILSYDSESKNFTVIDQKNLDTRSFCYHQVSLEDTKQAAYAEIINRKTFDNVDFVAIKPTAIFNESNNKALDASQFNEIIKRTCLLLEQSAMDELVIIERLINYIKIEKEVFEYEGNNKVLDTLIRYEKALRRTMMNYLRGNNLENKREILIEKLKEMQI